MEKYNWINEEIKINFPLSDGIKRIIKILEEMDITENYAYFNYSEALECAAKELVVKGKMTTKEWELLCAKYGGLI